MPSEVTPPVTAPQPMDYTIVEVGPGDASAIADLSIRSYEAAFGQPFYMDHEAAVLRWERYMRGEHHPRDPAGLRRPQG